VAIGGVIFYNVHRVVACRTKNVLPVMYIGLGGCVSLCFTFAMVANKFTTLVACVYNFGPVFPCHAYKSCG
jgi:hypothetical protein